MRCYVLFTSNITYICTLFLIVYIYIHINLSYHKLILLIYMCMYVCTCVWYPKPLRVRDSWGQPETYYSACKQSGRLGINAAATTIKTAVFFGDEGICHVAVLILGDKRQDPGIMRIIIEISQTMTFKINGGLCPMMFLAVIEKELCLSLCAYTWRWDLSLRRLCTTQSPHFCWYLPFIVHCMCFWSIYL